MFDIVRGNLRNVRKQITDALNSLLARVLPPGGAPGQVLGKLTGLDFDTGWIDQTGGGGGAGSSGSFDGGRPDTAFTASDANIDFGSPT